MAAERSGCFRPATHPIANAICTQGHDLVTRNTGCPTAAAVWSDLKLRLPRFRPIATASWVNNTESPSSANAAKPMSNASEWLRMRPGGAPPKRARKRRQPRPRPSRGFFGAGERFFVAGAAAILARRWPQHHFFLAGIAPPPRSPHFARARRTRAKTARLSGLVGR